MKPMILLFLVALATVVYGCSNAKMAAFSALMRPHHVQCWSGGLPIYDGHTTGKIENELHSDGYYFQEAGSGKLVMVSGNCLITVD